MFKRVGIIVAVLAVSLGLHIGSAAAVTLYCATTLDPYCSSSGVDFVGEDTGIDSGHNCDKGASGQDCMVVNGSGLFVNYFLAQGLNQSGSTLQGTYRVYAHDTSGSYFLLLKSITRSLPDDGSKHGIKWCNKDSNGVCQGFNYTHEPFPPTAFCGGFWVTGNTYPLGGSDDPHGTCVAFG